MTNEEFELKQENQRLLSHIEELAKEKDELRDELNYHKTDSHKFAMVVKEREQEITDLEKGRGALSKRVVELEIALRIKTEEHDCCAEDNISLRKHLTTNRQLNRILMEERKHIRYLLVLAYGKLYAYKINLRDPALTSQIEKYLQTTSD